MLQTLDGVAGALRNAAPALANHLWQSTLFALIAAGLALALKKNQARARYWIWMSASAKLLLPFALLAGVASHFVKPHPVAAPTNVQMYAAVEDVSEPFVEEPPAVAVATNVSHAWSGRPASADPTRYGETVTNGAPGFVARVVPMLPLLCGGGWVFGFAAGL